jgi:hypothetical protein
VPIRIGRPPEVVVLHFRDQGQEAQGTNATASQKAESNNSPQRTLRAQRKS